MKPLSDSWLMWKGKKNISPSPYPWLTFDELVIKCLHAELSMKQV